MESPKVVRTLDANNVAGLSVPLSSKQLLICELYSAAAELQEMGADAVVLNKGEQFRLDAVGEGQYAPSRTCWLLRHHWPQTLRERLKTADVPYRVRVVVSVWDLIRELKIIP